MKYIRHERAVFIGETDIRTEKLLASLKPREFILDIFYAKDSSSLIRLCFDKEPAILMMEMRIQSVNTYVKVRDIDFIGHMPLIAFAAEASESSLRLCGELGAYRLILLNDPPRKCASELSKAITEKLHYDSIDDIPPDRGHIVTGEYWHDPIREIADVRKAVSELLEQLGVRSTLSGHKYLVSAIVMQTSLIGPPKPKRLYTLVAKSCRTTPLAVEKAIRYAIESAWTNGDIYMQNRLFGYSTDASRGKPTNAEFIARLVLEFDYP